MRKIPLLVAVTLPIAAVLTAGADTIVCTDGRTIEGVISSESEADVTVNVGGAALVIPRVKIKSITRTAPGADARLKQSWEKLDERYKAESFKAEEEASVSEAAPAAAGPPEPAQPEEQEQIVFPTEPPAPVIESQPDIPTAEQRRLDREQEVRRAIHERRVVTGMTPEQVQAAWGFPFSTAPVDNVDTHTDRWTYHRPEGRVHVYFEDGKVVSVTQ